VVFFIVKDMLKKYWLYIFIFLMFEIFLIIFFVINKNEKIDTYLTSIQQTYLIQFDAVSQSFNNLAENTFFGIINKPEVINPIKNSIGKDSETKKYNRELLYKQFLPDSERLKEFQFEQIQFHFSNNTSFLRMHKPNFFDDNLSSTRLSVKMVNELLKPVSGFEIGKHIDGFRYLFPIFDEKLKHIGSVELVVPAINYQFNFEKVFQLDTHFLIHKKVAKYKMEKEVFEEKIISIENSDYFVSKLSQNEITIFDKANFLSDSERKYIKVKMDKEESFIFYTQWYQQYYTVSFIHIHSIEKSNKSAYLVLYKKAPNIEQIYANYHKILFILTILFIIFLFILYKTYQKDTKSIREKEILSQQSKLASMGEMIGNIAHQWRQPLSVISTATSGMKLQHEYGLLNEEKLIQNLDLIFKNTQFLSQTIEDFRVFFNTEKDKISFDIKENIHQVIDMFKESFKSDGIIIIDNLSKISIVSYPNDFKQVIVNMLKNAKDAINQDGYIIITTQEDKNHVVITIQDSGGGIPNDIIKKIFEPYFTTKHQSQGTGLGLYMVYEIIENNFNGTITVENIGFDYNFKYYYGACFRIVLDKNKL